MRLTAVFLSLFVGASAFAADKPLDSHGRTQADYDKKVAAVRKIAPAGFTVIVKAPFVVAGDDEPERVKMFADRTIVWAVEKLKKEYFDKDPEAIITVWLFKDKESYDKHTKQLFNDNPGTPYGYYSPRHEALIMNIATGGGTLVHEIVHPFIAANFEHCPPWLNEGLGSLYEQSAERNGRIVGLTNWRLAGLQRAIKNDKTITFKKLCGLDHEAFYGENSGLHYAQARYLCYYLQEKGLLQKFYKAAVANAEKDPGGYNALVETLGEKDMADFEARWTKWVLTLTFP